MGKPERRFVDSEKRRVPSASALPFSSEVGSSYCALCSKKHESENVFAGYEQEGIIEEVPSSEVVSSQPTYYMPHRPAVKGSSSSTKVRPVIHASATSYSGISLNDCHESGPSLNPDLVKLLIRFRKWKVALTADITKAFLPICVRPEDRKVHRFSWKCKDSIRMMFVCVPSGIDLDMETHFMSTKRAVLSLIAKLFDPLGLISSFVMYAKILFQDIWRLGLEWDELLPEELQNKFQNWVMSIAALKYWKINRCYFPEMSWKELSGLELQRKELLDVLLCAKFLDLFMSALCFDKTVTYCYWADSKVALA
ncbi:uncharacterized protein [Penaeus vannamei]|uniref:uncharacterized protein n=1 Tax=Penaeus vannamei TaxID=6689 RepID=UPI00387F5D2F